MEAKNQVGSRWGALRVRAGVIAGLMVLALAACGSEDAGEGPETLRVGFLYDVHAANVWTLPECENDDVRFEMVNFKQYAEVQRAFASGDVDIASMGYQNMAQLVGDGFTDFKMIAGVGTGSQNLVLRKGYAASTWADLKGAKVGIPPNSFAEMNFRVGAEANGLKIEDVTLVPFPGAGPPMLAALKSGEIDVMAAWEPNTATASVEGIGDYAPFPLQDPESALGNATGVTYATNQVISESPTAVKAFVECLVERTDYLNQHSEEWAKKLVEATGLSQEVASQAITTGELDNKIYESSAMGIIQAFASQDLLKDVSAEVPNHVDYSFLEEVTGKSKTELGAATN